MVSYVRKPNTFDELLVQSSLTPEEIAAFFGSSYDANRFAFDNAGQLSGGEYVAILQFYGEPGPTLIYANPGGYFRAERRGDGKTVGFTFSPNSLATDPEFTAAGDEGGGGPPSGAVRYFTGRPSVIAAIQWSGNNFTAVQEFCAEFAMTAVDHGDGTIGVSGITGAGDAISVGSWISNSLAQAATDTDLRTGHQELPGAGPFEHSISG